MALKKLIVLGLTIAAIPLSTAVASAPVGTPTTLYCLSMEPITGTRIPTIECRTRADWASLEINVDDEWAQNGVGVIPKA